MAVALPGSEGNGNDVLEFALALLDSLTDKQVMQQQQPGAMSAAEAGGVAAMEAHAAVDAELTVTALALLTTLVSVLRRALLGESARVVVTLLGGAERAPPASRRAWIVALR
jgi:hypothetical protein